MKITKIGMRTTKTVIAVILTLIISEVFHLDNPILAGIAAIMTMETSVSESISAGKYRMYGTVLGGIFALIVSYIAPANYAVIGISLIVLINVCSYLTWEKAVRMAMIVFLAIILGYAEGDRFYYALNRIVDTLIGVITGTTINFLIRPPKVEENVLKTINNMYNALKGILENIVLTEKFNDLSQFKKEMVELEERYKLFVNDMKYHIGRKKDVYNYQEMFNNFEFILHHLVILNNIKTSPYIDEANRQGIERCIDIELPVQETREIDNLDIIYNYHLSIILTRIYQIEGYMYEGFV